MPALDLQIGSGRSATEPDNSVVFVQITKAEPTTIGPKNQSYPLLGYLLEALLHEPLSCE